MQGATDLASSERARCRSPKIVQNDKNFCEQCVDAVEPIASAKKALSTPRVLNDLYSMSRNPTGDSST